MDEKLDKELEALNKDFNKIDGKSKKAILDALGINGYKGFNYTGGNLISKVSDKNLSLFGKLINLFR